MKWTRHVIRRPFDDACQRRHGHGVDQRPEFQFMSTASIPAALPVVLPDSRSARLRERAVLPVGAFVLLTTFALLYALRGGIAALDRGDAVVWKDQVLVSLAVWWTCLPLLPFLAWLVRVAPLGRSHRLRNIALLLVGTFAAALVRHFVLTPVVTWSTGTPDVPASAIARTLTYFTTFLVMIGLLHAVYFYRGLRARELQAAQLARTLAEARLAALRAQVQPHFIFNTLNAIAALLHTDPMKADRMLTRFGALLRFVLRAGIAEEHSLAEEIAVLELYLELMMLRFGDRLRVSWDIDPALVTHAVPWLVLQPLVENAVEHGLGDRTGAGCIRIEARADGDDMRICVTDDGGGLPNGVVAEGIGLRNTRERLTQLYGSRGTLTLADAPGGGVASTVRIPIRLRPAA